MAARLSPVNPLIVYENGVKSRTRRGGSKNFSAKSTIILFWNNETAIVMPLPFFTYFFFSFFNFGSLDGWAQTDG